MTVSFDAKFNLFDKLSLFISLKVDKRINGCVKFMFSALIVGVDFDEIVSSIETKAKEKINSNKSMKKFAMKIMQIT